LLRSKGILLGWLQNELAAGMLKGVLSRERATELCRYAAYNFFVAFHFRRTLMTSEQVFVQPRRNAELLFALAVAFIGCLYVILVPLVSYVTGTVMATFDAPTPKVIAALIPLSPFLPLGIGAVCIGLLFWTHRSEGTGRKVAYGVVASAIVVGILWVALTLLPAIQLMAALPE
jgi:hypothetical protein